MTVVLSVVLELFPRISAMITKSNSTPPTTHTHGSVYQVVVVVVVVFVVLDVELVLSCAHKATCTKLSARVAKNVLKFRLASSCFMCDVFSDK
jgi:hypothetical protein